jgi:tRNA nucleotidyltransferase (CCA-adding enzyme)
MPATGVAELAVRGDELARAAGRKPGPWVATALAALLERVALGELPNETTALLEAGAAVVADLD